MLAHENAPMSDASTRTVLTPSRGLIPLDIRELVAHRELLWFLTWRDIKVRYKQTLLGVLWAVLQPLATMVVFTVFFGRLAGMQSDVQGPYALFAYTGLLVWLFFANSVVNASQSLVANTNLVTKVYFPRLFVPLAATFAALVDYAIALVLLFAIILFYGVAPDLEFLALPLVLPVAFLAASGVGMLLAALNVEYRDVRHATPFLIQLWLFLTPVIYPVTLVPEKWSWLLFLNPMSGIVHVHRAVLDPNTHADWGALAISFAVSAVIFLVGAFTFKRMERSFADVI